MGGFDSFERCAGGEVRVRVDAYAREHASEQMGWAKESPIICPSRGASRVTDREVVHAA